MKICIFQTAGRSLRSCFACLLFCLCSYSRHSLYQGIAVFIFLCRQLCRSYWCELLQSWSRAAGWTQDYLSVTSSALTLMFSRCYRCYYHIIAAGRAPTVEPTRTGPASLPVVKVDEFDSVLFLLVTGHRGLERLQLIYVDSSKDMMRFYSSMLKVCISVEQQ